MIGFTECMVLATALLIIVLVWQYGFSWYKRKLPPGPRGYPLVGNVGQINFEDLINEFRRLRKLYGDVFMFRLFNKPIVVINGPEAMKDLLVKEADALSERPDNMVPNNPHNLGIAPASGELWKEHRSFALKTLRDFGFGKRSLEVQITEEVEVFLQDVKATDGAPFDIQFVLSASVSNIICSLVFGRRFDHSDPRLLKLLDFINTNFSDSRFLLTSIFPALRHLPGDPLGAKARRYRTNQIRDFLTEIVNEHKETFDDQCIRDYIDAFIAVQNKEIPEKTTFTDDQLVMTLTDLFIAGSETTATTLRWAVLYLIHNPEIQNQMRKEIDDVIGSSQIPSMTHKASLPFCEAVILEVQRIGSIAPFSVVHAAKYDVQYKDFVIPKGCTIMPNLNSIAMDEHVFENPTIFKPERFLGDDGKVYGQSRSLPFSIGRRVCLGESLAKTELFIFLVSLVQKFELKPKDSSNLPQLDGKLGATYSPKPFEIRAVTRS